MLLHQSASELRGCARQGSRKQFATSIANAPRSVQPSRRIDVARAQEVVEMHQQNLFLTSSFLAADMRLLVRWFNQQDGTSGKNIDASGAGATFASPGW
jgi:hypothetical protein